MAACLLSSQASICWQRSLRCAVTAAVPALILLAFAAVPALVVALLRPRVAAAAVIDAVAVSIRLVGAVIVAVGVVLIAAAWHVTDWRTR